MREVRGLWWVRPGGRGGMHMGVDRLWMGTRESESDRGEVFAARPAAVFSRVRLADVKDLLQAAAAVTPRRSGGGSPDPRLWVSHVSRGHLGGSGEVARRGLW